MTKDSAAIGRFKPELESLRGVAALCVAGEHCFISFVKGSAPEFETVAGIVDFIALFVFPGAAAVPLFFVLSGFVLGRAMKPSVGEALATYPGYAFRRLFRIVPAMWLSVALVCVLAPQIRGQAVPAGLILDHLIFQEWHLNGPMWSLRIELYLSLMLPVLFLISIRVGAIGNVLILAFLVHLMYRPGVHFVMTFAACFHLGLLSARYGRQIIEWLPRLATLTLLLVAIVGFTAAHNISRLYFNGGYSHFQTITAFTSFVIVTYVAHQPESAFGSFLRLSPLRILGRVSYSFYLFHFIVKDVCAIILSRAVGGEFIADNLLLTQILLFFASVAATLAVAAVTYRFVELPFISLGHRLAESRFGRLPTLRSQAVVAPKR